MTWEATLGELVKRLQSGVLHLHLHTNQFKAGLNSKQLVMLCHLKQNGFFFKEKRISYQTVCKKWRVPATLGEVLVFENVGFYWSKVGFSLVARPKKKGHPNT